MHVPGEGHEDPTARIACHAPIFSESQVRLSPSCPIFPSRLGVGAFSRKLCLPHLGREPSLIRFPPRQGGRGLGYCSVAPCWAAPGQLGPLQEGSALASLKMERAMRPVLGPPWSRAPIGGMPIFIK
jgi:hypothetical protein